MSESGEVKPQFIASKTNCEICKCEVFAIDLDKIQVSNHALWVCDECRREIKENQK